MKDYTSFQYCQKIVIFSSDGTSVLLGKRVGEQDYDGVFSFFGGKMEITDKDILDGLKREKNEELGENVKIKVYTPFTLNLSYRKKDGRNMILPHYYAIYLGGTIQINKKEYSEYKWVQLSELKTFEPKVETIPNTVMQILRLQKIMEKEDFVVV